MPALGEALRDRVPRDPGRVDALLAGGFLVAGLVQVLVLLPIGSPLVGVLAAGGYALPLAWRRRRPAAAALAHAAAWLLPTDGYILLGYVIAALIFFSVGSLVRGPWRLGAVLSACTVAGVVSTLRGDEPFGAVFGAVLVVAAPALAGRLHRRDRERAHRLAELAAAAERTAVLEERARIARELHDVIGHSVTAIALHATAAEAVIERRPDQARAALVRIHATAHEALQEVRRAVGVLRDEAAADLAPQPGLADLPALIDAAARSGTDVTMEVEGEERPLAPALALSAYRIVQEALTNARRHAAGAAVRVRLTWRRDALEVEVVDAGAAAGAGASRPVAPAPADGGHGLVGMRERARAHGGTLQAGRRTAGGFVVAVSLPLEDA